MNKNSKWYTNKIKYITEYSKKNVKKISVHINMVTDPELYEFISTVQNPSGYIKELIRVDMRNKKD